MPENARETADPSVCIFQVQVPWDVTEEDIARALLMELGAGDESVDDFLEVWELSE